VEEDKYYVGKRKRKKKPKKRKPRKRGRKLKPARGLTETQRNLKMLAEIVSGKEDIQMIGTHGDTPNLKYRHSSEFGAGISDEALSRTIVKLSKKQIMDKPFEISLEETLTTSIHTISMMSRSIKVGLLEIEETTGKKTVDFTSKTWEDIFKATKKTLELVKLAKDCVQTNEVILKHVQDISGKDMQSDIRKNLAVAKQIDLIEQEIGKQSFPRGDQDGDE